MNNFCEKYNVSRETYLKLDRYCQSLTEWQEKFNLISKNTLNDIFFIQKARKMYNFAMGIRV